MNERLLRRHKEKKMPIFKVSCSWEVYATARVEANSLEEAIKTVEQDDFPLPNENHYIDGSFTVDREMSEELNAET